MFRVGLRLHLPRLETGNNPPNLESGCTSTLPNVTIGVSISSKTNFPLYHNYFFTTRRPQLKQQFLS